MSTKYWIGNKIYLLDDEAVEYLENLEAYKEVWEKIKSMLEGRFFGDFTVQEKIVAWMDEILKEVHEAGGRMSEN